MNHKFIQRVSIDWNQIDRGSYLHGIEAIKNMEFLDFQKNITFFVGENGTGKSTLLEAIAAAYGFNPEGGTMNYRFSTFHDVSELSSAIRMVKGYRRPKSNYFFRAESFFNVASKTEDYRDTTPKCILKDSDKYEYVRVGKPFEQGMDIVVYKWQGGYAFLVNNEDCKSVQITDETGTHTIEITEENLYPFIFYQEVIPSDYKLKLRT